MSFVDRTHFDPAGKLISSSLPFAQRLGDFGRVVLILTSIRKKREHQPPASLGLPYFREDR